MLTEAEALELAELEKEFNKPERVKIARPERGLVADLASSAARGLALGATGLSDLPRMLGSLALKQRLPRRSLTERAETFLDSTPLKRSQNMSGKVVEEIAGLAGSGGALGLAGRGALKLGAKSLGRGLKGVSNIGSNKWANVGAGTALAFEKENPNTDPLRQFVVSLGGSMVGRSTVGGASSALSKFKNNDYKKLDDLARKAVEKSHQDISQQYGSLMNLIKKGIKNKDVDLKPVYQGLVDQYQSLKSPAAKHDFLKSDLGKVYTQFKEYPQKVSFNEAETLRAMLRRKGEAAGAFEPTRSSTGGAFRKMDGKFNEQMQETVRKYAPKKLKDYQEANKLWSHKKSFLDPLREDIDKNGHLLGGRFNASVKGIGEGATHSNHVLENLYGKDRHEFAKAALKELRSGKGLELTKPGKSLRNLSENYFNVPKQHLDLMSHANKPTLMGKLGNMGLSSRLGNLSLSSIAALPKGLTPSEALELAELEREFGGRHEHKSGELVHLNDQEMRALKRAKLVKDETDKLKALAQKGHRSDTRIGRISHKTAVMLNGLMPDKRREINPDTKLSQYGLLDGLFSNPFFYGLGAKSPQERKDYLDQMARIQINRLKNVDEEQREQMKRELHNRNTEQFNNRFPGIPPEQQGWRHKIAANVYLPMVKFGYQYGVPVAEKFQHPDFGQYVEGEKRDMGNKNKDIMNELQGGYQQYIDHRNHIMQRQSVANQKNPYNYNNPAFENMMRIQKEKDKREQDRKIQQNLSHTSVSKPNDTFSERQQFFQDFDRQWKKEQFSRLSNPVIGIKERRNSELEQLLESYKAKKPSRRFNGRKSKRAKKN